MLDLTFAEQVKIVLGRKGMTIKELAERIEEQTGRKMSRQNLTQRLGRDNFQEKDMRMIAEILGCPFQLNILSSDGQEKEEQDTVPSTIFLEPKKQETILETEKAKGQERDITIGELLDIHEELEVMEKERSLSHKTVETETLNPKEIVIPGRFSADKQDSNVNEAKNVSRIFKEYMKKPDTVHSQTKDREKEKKSVVRTLSKRGVMPVRRINDRDEGKGEINPQTGREYESNSVRVHPARIGYVQVYDREKHQWIDMTEWAFMGYQERKKVVLGDKYEPPIYLE